ncbi:hypothetical protein M5K25_022746 [Dendrobium thyrsiflorum]|uniref:Uncharacterized protein n=1 Tax=Dendrobium thyrsiflorum TaxID=117978 RepID=A0ABD0UD31_DENTH
MTPPEEKAGDLYIWFITCFFFLIIISGGIFLVQYITQPETDKTNWLPIAGMALIAMDLLDCRRNGPNPAPADSQVYSPGGGRRVRIGAVIGTQGDSVNGTADHHDFFYIISFVLHY